LVQHAERANHGWQQLVATNLSEAFEEAAESDDPRLKAIVKQAYNDLIRSVEADGGYMLPFAEAYKAVKTLITGGELNIQRVNSDVELEPILDPEHPSSRTAPFSRISPLQNCIAEANRLATALCNPTHCDQWVFGRNPYRRPNCQVVLTDAAHARHIVQIDPRNVTTDRESAGRERTLDPIAARKEASRAAGQTSLSTPGPKCQGREVSPAVRERAEKLIAAKPRTQRSAPGKDKDHEIEL
jgi:hypothetical protein